jgi:hypothetical protein
MSQWLPSMSAEVMGQQWAPGPSAPTLDDAEAHVWRTNVDAVLAAWTRREAYAKARGLGAAVTRP